MAEPGYVSGEDLFLLADGREITRPRRWAAAAAYVLAALAALASDPERGLLTDPAYSAGLLFGMLVVYWLAMRLLSRERDDEG